MFRRVAARPKCISSAAATKQLSCDRSNIGKRGQVLAVTGHYIVAMNLCRIGLDLRNLARPALLKALIAAAMLLVTPSWRGAPSSRRRVWWFPPATSPWQLGAAPTRPGAAAGSNIPSPAAISLCSLIAPRTTRSNSVICIFAYPICVFLYSSLASIMSMVWESKGSGV